MVLFWPTCLENFGLLTTVQPYINIVFDSVEKNVASQDITGSYCIGNCDKIGKNRLILRMIQVRGGQDRQC